MRLLLVEDDNMLGDGIRKGLKHSGYAVDWVQDGDSADLALKSEDYDVVVLDLGIPKRSGLDVLKDMRSRGQEVPVLILTARDTVDDRVRGLDTGADDYLVKPFDLDELSARIRALLRRHSGRSTPLIQHNAITLDPASHTVTRDGDIVDISPREFAVLQTLLDNVGRVVSRARLEEGLYAWNEEVESNAIEVHIHHLRKKLGSDLIRTIRGIGYIVDKSK
jgi:two-component system response regulator QseB